MVPSPVRVWLYGDYGCPFTYLADRRLQLLARERPLRVIWRPLALYPEAVLRRAAGVGHGASWDVPAGQGEAGEDEALLGELRRAAGDLGLSLHLPAPRVETALALQAAEFARDLGYGAFQRFHRTLFEAYFGRGRDIGARAVLLELSEQAGIDREALERALEDGRYETELDAAREEATRYGITGTPGLLFGRFLLLGAAPLEELRCAADRAEREGES